MMQRILTLLVVGCALTFVVAQVPSLRAESAAAAAKALPVKATFHKDKNAEAGPYVLTIKNTSDQALKISGQVLLAVAFHATDKARSIAEETIAPGKSIKVKDLASDDKVTIKADGYEPLQLTVPGKK